MTESFAPPILPRLTPTISALRVDQVTAEVVRAFRAADVPSILLKGPSVASWLYADGSPRSYIDSDLLVPTERQWRAGEILEELGFSPILADEDTPGWRLAAHVWARGDGAQVDLHRTLIGASAAPAAVWEALSSSTERMSVAGTEVSVLSVPARCFQLALHATQHGRDDDRRVEDLARALGASSFDDWSEAARLARRLDAVPAFSVGLRLLPEGAGMAAQLKFSLGGSTEALLRSGNAPRGALGLEELARTRGLRARLGLIARNFVPPVGFMRAWSPLARRGRLGLAAAYLWRPVAILIRGGPAAVAWLRAHRRASA